MRRRVLTAGLAGAAVWRLRAARGQQQTDRMRRIGVLFGAAADDPESQTRIAAFAQELAQLGWARAWHGRGATRLDRNTA